MQIGVIGLGKMGLPIAVNLMQRGYAVVAYNRSGSPDLVAAGGAMAKSPSEVARQCDVLISILPDVAAVRAVVCDPATGTLTALNPGTVHIEMSTIDVDAKLQIREEVRKHGGELLDCPISGSPGMVAPRLATTFASGEANAVERVRPVLDAISGRWVYSGDFGCGTHLKYVTNLLVAVHTVAAAEALVLARKSGLDLDLVQRSIDDSIGASAIWKQRGPLMQKREWLPAPGPIDTLHAILQQIEQYQETLEFEAPVFTAAKSIFDKAVADGRGHLDIASVHDQLSGDSNASRGD